MRRVIMSVLVLQISACAAGLDLLDHSVGGMTATELAEPQGRRATEKADHWREVWLDPHDGLVCVEVTRPWVAVSTTTVAIEPQNGSRSLTWVGVAFDVLISGLGTVYIEGYCHTEGHDCNRVLDYGLLSPFALSLAWGAYRLATIRPQIVTGGTVRPTIEQGDEHDESRAACPVGTMFTLVAGGASFAAHIDQDGRMASGQLAELAAFLSQPTPIDVALGDLETRVDVDHAAEFLAAQAAPQALLPATPRLRATIDWTPAGPVASGAVKRDFGNICVSSSSCPERQRCGDRGDGVPQCLGPGSTFCERDTDCERGWQCLAGAESNGVRRCAAP
jgi:hypothetical protein